jgi:hypothetical protein
MLAALGLLLVPLIAMIGYWGAAYVLNGLTQLEPFSVAIVIAVLLLVAMIASEVRREATGFKRVTVAGCLLALVVAATAEFFIWIALAGCC